MIRESEVRGSEVPVCGTGRAPESPQRKAQSWEWGASMTMKPLALRDAIELTARREPPPRAPWLEELTRVRSFVVRPSPLAAFQMA